MTTWSCRPTASGTGPEAPDLGRGVRAPRGCDAGAGRAPRRSTRADAGPGGQPAPAADAGARCPTLDGVAGRTTRRRWPRGDRATRPPACTEAPPAWPRRRRPGRPRDAGLAEGRQGHRPAAVAEGPLRHRHRPGRPRRAADGRPRHRRGPGGGRRGPGRRRRGARPGGGHRALWPARRSARDVVRRRPTRPHWREVYVGVPYGDGRPRGLHRPAVPGRRRPRRRRLQDRRLAHRGRPRRQGRALRDPARRPTPAPWPTQCRSRWPGPSCSSRRWRRSATSRRAW